MSHLLAQSEPELEVDFEDAPTSAAEAIDVVGEQLGDVWRGVLESLPIIVIGIVVLILALLVAMLLARVVSRGIDHAGIDRSAGNLLARLARLVLIVVAVLFALSVVGVSVTSVIALLAVAGLAVGLAVQGILENFIAGVILLIRKPFRIGDQVITGDFEGTVDDIDFRVTRLITYDGTVNLIPNGDVYSTPIVNLTTRGKRRTTLTVGIDYRDDHDRAQAVIAQAVAGVDGVLEDPVSEVLLAELGDSSINFEVRYWTRPDIASVRHTQDRVLRAVKRAIEDAGMTIPWPIRTLVVDSDSDIRVSRPHPTPSD